MAAPGQWLASSSVTSTPSMTTGWSSGSGRTYLGSRPISCTSRAAVTGLQWIRPPRKDLDSPVVWSCGQGGRVHVVPRRRLPFPP